MWQGLVAAAVLVALAGAVAAETRCRSTRSGSTTYTTCEGDSKTRCRTFKVGSAVYSRCT